MVKKGKAKKVQAKKGKRSRTKKRSGKKVQKRGKGKPHKKRNMKTFLSRLSKKNVPPKGRLIGNISHYFPKVKAGVIIIRTGQLKVNDRIFVKGHTTSFEQTVGSIQIDRTPISVAKKGDEIGIRVKKRVRQGDEVFRLR